MCFIIMLDINCVLVYICLQFVTCFCCFISYLYAHIYITFSLRLHKSMFFISSLYMLKHCMHFGRLYTLYIVSLFRYTCFSICNIVLVLSCNKSITVTVVTITHVSYYNNITFNYGSKKK